MTKYAKAVTLEQIGAQTVVEPLKSGDPRWVDLSASRDDDDLKHLRLQLKDFAAQENRFAKIAFTGHRGCGKSTELFRLERDLQDRFFPLHLFADETLLQDCDYTDLMLWLVDSLVTEFPKHGLGLHPKLVETTVDWFAEKAIERVDQLKTELAVETEAEVKAGGNLLLLSARLIARVKSMFKGSTERRLTMRRNLQKYANELIDQVNLLLDEAVRTLESAGYKPDLLIVQDNLDRLPPETARRLFLINGDLLKSLKAHVIYTVPIAMVLAPASITSTFEHSFTMPMVKVAKQDGEPHAKGIQGLMKIVSQRMEIAKVFTAEAVARRLAVESGGSVRDLMRLINYAQLAARGEGKSKIDDEAADSAVTKLRLEFEKLLIPGQTYYPLLARVHADKQPWVPDVDSDDPRAVEAAREFFSQLLFNGTVLEYNGGETWYDVHPVITKIKAFRQACAST